MCFHLYLASPLTLSEVRSMLPKGLAADLLDPVEQRALRQLHPDAQTVARLVHGACSCDLVVQRHPVIREDETWLRRRYRDQGLPRTAVLAALERHRRAAAERSQPPGFWPRQVADFVVEHARNAGPTLYYLHFSHDGTLGVLPPGEPPAQRASGVRINPEGWLLEERPALVLP
jgi:hypothetical protein